MSRPLRIQYANALYHVISRGNARGLIVRDDADRVRRLTWLEESVRRFGWKLHAFCLMPNHEHLFVQTPEANLSDGMKLLNAAYTQYFNVRHRRSGHLFQGRYKAHLVETEGHYAELSRYIHLNPVRARSMTEVADPVDYAWSSFRGYVRKRDRRAWVTYDRVLGGFGPGSADARARRYGVFVRAGVADPPERPWRRPWGGAVIGSKAFYDGVKKRLGKVDEEIEVPEAQAFLDRPDLETVILAAAGVLKATREDWSAGRRDNGATRSLVAWLCRDRMGFRGSDVARALGYRDGGSVTRSAARVSGSAELLRAGRRLERRVQGEIAGS